ncbi:carbohydrate sulfotransferase 4-like isoform X1 [Bombyx mandarina]|uniref:Carbohydrate sulfotransferase 4-like isoform X1 n=2 Tax=Bombyx mandarina TaxID=7092 RepID=A0A6J2K4D8_BOMMA|nr:carbohydrate sulfotransferase 4-like isoform X1 [Bombyx mandarina]XP_028035853.1 carbohydrate sulfotransferase 4-like isoform X1 [Bombyx mandarina]
MFRRVNFYSICFAFGLSVLLILAGSRYTDNTNYRPMSESRRNIKNFFKVDDGEDTESQPVPTNSYDGTPNIEKILEKTRAKIQFELWNYNFTYSGVKKLDDLIIETGGRPLRSIIISSWRSGSTFLGEVINAIPGTYYHYEPFLNYGIIQIRGSPLAETVLNSIKDMLKCNFEEMDDFLDYGRGHNHQFSHNTRLWDHCKYKKELCFDSDFMSKFCKLFPFQSMKVVRLRLRLVQELLEDKELNAKVVFLIRDPRGVLQSRLHRDFCHPSPDCSNPELLCADMISDYVAASRLLKLYPDKLMVLRYEDLALNLNSTTHKLLKFLRLSHMQAVDEYLNSHTNTEVSGVSSTFRVSREVPFRWKNILDFEYADQIQMACKEAMNLWGYRMAHNATHMTSKEFDPLETYTITQ